MLISIFMVLLMDVFSSKYVKEKYGKAHAEYSNIEESSLRPQNPNQLSQHISKSK